MSTQGEQTTPSCSSSNGRPDANHLRGVLKECLRRRAAGEDLPDEEIIRANPGLMPELGCELSLLRLMRRARDASNGDGPPSALAAAERPLFHPDAIPGYRLIRELHRGGQGVVYVAHQASTRRDVAVKIMHRGPFASPSDRSRFQREVELLVRLRHPNIVFVHDTGTAGNSHYLVMDLIDGAPLDRYVQSRWRADGLSRPGLRAVLELFASICDAVHAAHLRGVIHRDLKPGNILIDAGGEPHILDFGLAKDLSDIDAPSVTGDGQFVGSIPWASPEQVTGTNDIDVRTDVYSLGVVLFQMLTGEFPYKVVGPIADVFREITATPPCRPRTIQHIVDDDVEIIVLKCLSKEPDRRYQSAGELARDIRHYLAGEPIEARRDSAAYVLGKTLRRYRWPLAAAATLMLGLAGFAAYAWSQAQANRAMADRERVARTGAEAATTDARAARDAESEQRRLAESQAQRAASVTAFLVGTLGLADPDVTQVPDMSMKTMLDRAAAQVGGAFADQPDSEATVRLVIGRAYATLGELEAARVHLGRAVEIHEALDSNPGLLYEALLPYTHVLNELGHPGYRGRWWQVYRLYPKLFQSASPELAGVQVKLGLLLGANYEPQKAEPLFEEFRRISTQSLKPGDPLWQVTADFLHLGGANLAFKKDPGAARIYLREALAIERRSLPETHTRIIRTLGELVHATLDAGLHVEAEALSRESLELLRKALPDDHWYVALHRARLGACLIGQGRFEEAEGLLLENLPRIEAARGATSAFAREGVERLIDLYEAWSRPDAAAPWRKSMAVRLVGSTQFNHPIGLLRRIFGPDHAAMFPALDHFDRSTLGPDRIAAIQELLPLSQWQIPDDDVRAAVIAEYMCATADSLADRNQYNDSTLAMLREADRIARATDHFHPRKRAWIIRNLARNLVPRHEYIEAEHLAREALAIVESRLGKGDSLGLLARSTLGAALLGQNRYAEAEPLLLAEFQRRLLNEGAADEDTHIALVRLITLNQALGRPDNALAHAYAVAQGQWLAWKDIKPIFAALHPALAEKMTALNATPADDFDGIAAALHAVLEARKAAFGIREPAAMVYAGALHRIARSRAAWTFSPVWIPAQQEVREITMAHMPADWKGLSSVDWWLATLKNRNGAFGEAEAVVRESLRVGYQRPGTVPTRDSPLAAALNGQGRISEGEPLLLSAYEALVGGDTIREPYGSECFGYMMNLYVATGRPDEARRLAEPVLRRALERSKDAYLLRRLACHVIVHPGLPAELYELASQVAHAADQRVANSKYIQLMLPAADYRMARFESALEGLERLSPPTDDKSPMHAAFLAMTHHRLGHTREARSALQHGRSYLQNHGAIATVQERSLLAEAAKLIDSP